jgi:GT2 family glycosyltransferase
VKQASSPLLQQTFAIVIVNYNGGQILENCLQSIAGQSRIPDRVILVDNNSDNFSVARARDILPQVDIIQLDENIGFAAANNRAINLIDDIDWVILLNPDTVARPDWLEKFILGASRYPECQFFGCRMLADEKGKLDGTGDVYHVSGANWRRGYGKADNRYTQDDEIFAPSGAAALYRRDLYQEAGGLNESFFCYMEDIDLGFRLRLLGHRCYYIADAVVLHHGAALTGQYSDFQVYHGHRNMVWVYIMNMPAAWLWLYMPQHLMYNLASVIRFFLLGKAGTILRSKRDAIRGIGRAWKERKRIQSMKKVDNQGLREIMAHGILTPYLNRYE